jgi:hypothetical protein
VGFTYTSGAWLPAWTPRVGDLDGDGADDVFLHKETTGQWFQMISNKVGNFVVGSGQSWTLGWNLYPTDLNGDGRMDFVLYNPVSGDWYQARNLSAGFSYTNGSLAPGLTLIVGSPIR